MLNAGLTEAMKSRHSFSIGGKSLKAFGGVILQPPKHTIAVRDTETVTSYAYGDEIIDNGHYKNVEFDIVVGFRCDLFGYNARILAEAVTDWLSSLTLDYQRYEDTYNGGVYSEAKLTSAEPLTMTSRGFFETTLAFSRRPYWYYEKQRLKLPSDGTALTLENPSSQPAKPTLILNSVSGGLTGKKVTVNGTELSLATTIEFTEQRYDGEEMRHILILPNGNKYYLDTVLPPNLFPKGQLNQISTNVSSGNVYIIPNWRRL